MQNDLFNAKTIMMGIVGSLTGFVFYGHINLKARVDTIETKQNQVLVEQRDLWGKYNQEADYKINSIRTYYKDKLRDESEKVEFWKQKFQETKK